MNRPAIEVLPRATLAHMYRHERKIVTPWAKDYNVEKCGAYIMNVCLYCNL